MMAWDNNKASASLTRELLRASRLGNVQGGLPPILKVAPAIAIAAGSVISKATGSHVNLVEESMLGSTDGVIALEGPQGSARMGGKGPQAADRQLARDGVSMMCARCQGVGFEREAMNGYETWKAMSSMNIVKGATIQRRDRTSFLMHG